MEGSPLLGSENASAPPTGTLLNRAITCPDGRDLAAAGLGDGSSLAAGSAEGESCDVRATGRRGADGESDHRGEDGESADEQCAHTSRRSSKPTGTSLRPARVLRRAFAACAFARPISTDPIAYASHATA